MLSKPQIFRLNFITNFQYMGKTVKEENVSKQASQKQNEAKKVKSAPKKQKSTKSDEEKRKASLDKMKLKLKEYEVKNKELHDKYLRLSAEFDNYRKRTLKEKMELTKSAGEQLLVNILPVVDDFERGMKSISDAKDIESIKEGIKLIYNKLKEFLNQNGVKEIEASNKEFDIDYHEAITKTPVQDEKLKGKVVDIIEKGYILNDKVIRFSKVVVGE